MRFSLVHGVLRHQALLVHAESSVFSFFLHHLRGYTSMRTQTDLSIMQSTKVMTEEACISDCAQLEQLLSPSNYPQSGLPECSYPPLLWSRRSSEQTLSCIMGAYLHFALGIATLADRADRQKNSCALLMLFSVCRQCTNAAEPAAAAEDSSHLDEYFNEYLQ